MSSSKFLGLAFALSLVSASAWADPIIVGPSQEVKSPYKARFVIQVLDCDMNTWDADLSHLDMSKCRRVPDAKITPNYLQPHGFFQVRGGEPDLDYNQTLVTDEAVLPTFFTSENGRISVLNGFTIDAGNLGSDRENISVNHSLFHYNQTVTKYYAIKYRDQSNIIIAPEWNH
jgi:hypothetical protein